MHVCDAILTILASCVFIWRPIRWVLGSGVECACESPQIRGNVFPIMHACAKRSIIDAFTLLLAFHSPSLADAAQNRLLKRSLEAQF